MKIAQPLGWERLCSDSAADAAFVMAKQNAIQNCETRFQEVSKPSFAKEKKIQPLSINRMIRHN